MLSYDRDVMVREGYNACWLWLRVFIRNSYDACAYFLQFFEVGHSFQRLPAAFFCLLRFACFNHVLLFHFLPITYLIWAHSFANKLIRTSLVQFCCFNQSRKTRRFAFSLLFVTDFSEFRNSFHRLSCFWLLWVSRSIMQISLASKLTLATVCFLLRSAWWPALLHSSTHAHSYLSHTHSSTYSCRAHSYLSHTHTLMHAHTTTTC